MIELLKKKKTDAGISIVLFLINSFIYFIVYLWV